MSTPGKQPENNVFPVARRYRPVLLLLFLAFLPGSVAGDGGQAPSTGTRGVQVTRKVPFASETLEAVRAADAARSPRERKDRAIPRHRIDRIAAEGTPGMPQAPLEPPATPFTDPAAPFVTPSTPALASSFPGLGNPPPGEDVIPPDTMGAAGPNHLVTLLNSEIGVFDKVTGALLQSASLQSFWASLGTDPGEPAHFPFDTKVLYDQHSRRFIAVTLGGTEAPNSWIMVAVTSTPNPVDNWYKWAIPSARDNNAWADYPGFGLDACNVCVTVNMFD